MHCAIHNKLVAYPGFLLVRYALHLAFTTPTTSLLFSLFAMSSNTRGCCEFMYLGKVHSTKHIKCMASSFLVTGLF